MDAAKILLHSARGKKKRDDFPDLPFRSEIPVGDPEGIYTSIG